ncbi:D-alanine--D-alanine ligase [subsurface metagenome]
MQVQTKILSGTTAQKDLEKVKLIRGEKKLEAEICNIATLTYDALKGSDYCRVDLRMNNTGLYLLEINIMPGLGPLSFLPFAAKESMGLDYPHLISLLTKESMKKFGIQSG